MLIDDYGSILTQVNESKLQAVVSPFVKNTLKFLVVFTWEF